MSVANSSSPGCPNGNLRKTVEADFSRLTKSSRSRSVEDFNRAKPPAAGSAAPLDRSRMSLYDALDLAKPSGSQPLDNGVKEETQSGSCCLSSCIHRIYDFVCSLLRCVFCMKQKIKEPDLNTRLPQTLAAQFKRKDLTENCVQQDKFKAQNPITQPKVTSETALKMDERLPEATAFLTLHSKNLKDALVDFKKLESVVQNYVLHLLTLLEKYEDLHLYLDKGLDPQRKTTFESVENYGGPFSLETAKVNQEKLKEIFKKGF